MYRHRPARNRVKPALLHSSGSISPGLMCVLASVIAASCAGCVSKINSDSTLFPGTIQRAHLSGPPNQSLRAESRYQSRRHHVMPTPPISLQAWMKTAGKNRLILSDLDVPPDSKSCTSCAAIYVSTEAASSESSASSPVPCFMNNSKRALTGPLAVAET